MNINYFYQNFNITINVIDLDVDLKITDDYKTLKM